MRRQRNQWRPITVAEHEQFSARLVEALEAISDVLHRMPPGHQRLQNKLLRAKAQLLDLGAWLEVELFRDHRNAHRLKIYNWDTSSEKLTYQSPPTIYVVGEKKPKTLSDLYKRSND
jgi:hypothetical protein